MSLSSGASSPACDRDSGSRSRRRLAMGVAGGHREWSRFPVESSTEAVGCWCHDDTETG